MKSEHIRAIIDGNIQAIDQGIGVIESLSSEQYANAAPPYVKSTIGQHFRHVVDIFLAVVERSDSHIIDYDYRRRGTQIEADPRAAVDALSAIREWMCDICNDMDDHLERSVIIKTEVTITETHSVVLPSSLLRELVFSSSHAVHHYSLISVIAKLQGVNLQDSFGIAPATASYLRADEGSNDESSICVR